MRSEIPGDNDLGFDFSIGDSPDAQFGPTVAQQDAIARFDVLGQGGIEHLNLVCVALCGRGAQDELMTGSKGYGLGYRQVPCAELGTLEVLQDSDRFAGLVSDFADALDHLAVTLGIAMREVEPGYVHPSRGELAKSVQIARSWSDRGDDLGVAGHRYRSSFAWRSRSPRNSGSAISISALARSRIVFPCSRATPCSVAM